MTAACGAEAAGAAPASHGRIIQLRAAQEKTIILSSRDQHLAVGQQRRRVQVACGAEAAGRCSSFPVAGSYSSALLEGTSKPLNPPATSTLPWAAASRCDRRVRCRDCRCCSSVPVAGSYSSALLKS